MSAQTRKKLLQILLAAVIALVGVGLQLSSLVVFYPGEDEAGYLADGAALVEHGVVPAIGSGSLPAIVNGALYLPFAGDHGNLGVVSSIRRLLVFAILLFCAWKAGKALAGDRGGWLAFGLTAIGRPVAVALNNSADSLYTAFSAIAFFLLMEYLVEKGKTPNEFNRYGRPVAVAASLAVASLARLDGIILGVAVGILLFLLDGRTTPGRRSAGIYAGVFISIVGGWILLAALLRADWDLQIAQRSYLAFEQGHNFLYEGRYEVPPDPSSADLYGSAEENGYSVLLAITRNPGAFLSRFPLALGNAFRMYSNAYSIIGGVFFALLAFSGWVFWLGRDRKLALAILLWPLPLFGYLLASYRPGFFGTIYPQFAAVIATGLVPVLAGVRARLSDDGQRMLIAVTGCALAILFAANLQFGAQQTLVWIRGDRGASYGEWIRRLASEIPAGSCLITFHATDAVYSNLEVDSNWMAFYQVSDADSLRLYQLETGCNWVVVDEDMKSFAPEFASLVERVLTFEFLSPDGASAVYSSSEEPPS